MHKISFLWPYRKMVYTSAYRFNQGETNEWKKFDHIRPWGLIGVRKGELDPQVRGSVSLVGISENSTLIVLHLRIWNTNLLETK